MKKFLSFLVAIVFCLCLEYQSADAATMPDEKNNGWLWPVLSSRHISRGYNDSGHQGLDITGSSGCEVRASKDGEVVSVFKGCHNVNGAGNRLSCEARNAKIDAGLMPGEVKCEYHNPWKLSYKRSDWETAYTGYYCNYGYGNGVIIYHEDTDSYSRYAHMKSLTVEVGQEVARGDVIGYMGETGNCDGTHLHFAISSSMSGGEYNNNPNSADLKITVSGGTSGNSNWNQSESNDTGFAVDDNGIYYQFEIRKAPDVQTKTVGRGVDVTWEDVGASSYYVYVQNIDTKEIPWGQNVGKTFKTHLYFSAGNYRAFVTAVYSADVMLSGWSDFVAIEETAPTLSADVIGQDVFIKWNDVGATSYYLYAQELNNSNVVYGANIGSLLDYHLHLSAGCPFRIFVTAVYTDELMKSSSVDVRTDVLSAKTDKDSGYNVNETVTLSVNATSFDSCNLKIYRKPVNGDQYLFWEGQVSSPSVERSFSQEGEYSCYFIVTRSGILYTSETAMWQVSRIMEWATPTYKWSEDNDSVTATRLCLTDSARTETETVGTTMMVIKTATCEVNGETTYTSKAFDNTAFTVQRKTVDNIPALGHMLTAHTKVEATCTETGTEAYWNCSVCNKLFSDETATTEIEKPIVILAAGHALMATNANAATCTEPGNIACWTCETCGKHFSDAEGETEIAENSWIIPAKGHTLTATTAKAAACEEAGNSAYWTCKTCHKHFNDAEGETEIEENSWIIPAI